MTEPDNPTQPDSVVVDDGIPVKNTMESAAATELHKTSEDIDSVSQSHVCPFGSISCEALLEFDETTEIVGSQTVSESWIYRDCGRCRQRRSCCGCNRQKNVNVKKNTPAMGVGVGGPETDYEAWACWHCVRRFDVAESSACDSVISGTRKDESKSENGSVGNLFPFVSTAVGTSPRSTLRDKVSRAPGGNWWGGRSQLSKNSRNADAESYEMFHCRLVPDGDNDAESEENRNTSGYVAVSRDRYTVLNVGSYRVGDRTLADLDPADDPYMRKFRNCG